MVLPAHSWISQSMKSLSRNSEGESREKFHFTSLTVDELAYT